LIITGAVFILFRQRTFFLGDGYLILDLIEKGIPFRVLDNMDYVLHFQSSGLLNQFTESDPKLIYQIGSVGSGLASLVLLVFLLGKLPWPSSRKVLFLGLFLFSGSSLLFFGYVESYSFLYLFLTAFLVAGLLVLENKFPLWGASVFLGLGLFFHLTAIFGLPALFVLARSAPGYSKRQRWLATAGPVAGLLLLSAGIHHALGFNGRWLENEFLAGTNSRSFLAPFGGPQGIFSLHNLVQQINLVLLVSPVSLVLLFLRTRPLLRNRKNPAIAFLLTQAGTIAFLSLLLERKLGGARDWDLLAAHAAVMFLLAVIPTSPGISPGRADRHSRPPADLPIALALTVSFLAVVPWIAVNSSAQASVARFRSVSRGFPPYARAYAYEGLGQYFRDEDQPYQALAMYRKCVAARPGNARFHKLLGSMHLTLASREGCTATEKSRHLEQARDSFEAALDRDPNLDSVRDNLSRILVRNRKYSLAIGHLDILLANDPRNATAWSALGYCHLQLGSPAEAITCFERALRLDPDLKIRQYLAQARSRIQAPPSRQVDRRQQSPPRP